MSSEFFEVNFSVFGEFSQIGKSLNEQNCFKDIT